MAIALLLGISGCASVKYEKGDESLTYSRFGAISLNGLEVNRDKSGIVNFDVKNSKGDMGQMAEVLNRIIDMAGKTQTP